MTPLRVADAFRDEEHPDVTDGDFLVQCTCGLEQRVDTMIVDEMRELTLYDCSRCENTVVAILTENAATQLWLSSSAMSRRYGATGTRRNGYVVASRVDLAWHPPGADDATEVLYSSPDFFDALRNL